jgi:DNA (cytosine-5)-methyltransferase 1
MISIEICAGADGQALGLEQSGFTHSALVEIDPLACATLRKNRPDWRVIEDDVRAFSAKPYLGIDLLAGGVPCPPFSVAGKQLGKDDDRDLFPEALRLVEECDPALVDFCLDCHWLAGGGANPASWITRLSGRMSMIHFKDYDIGFDETSQPPRLFKAVGEGNIDWQPITAACKAAKIGVYVVEQDECERDPYDCIASSARYMRNTLGL